jgi:hypothetical protein
MDAIEGRIRTLQRIAFGADATDVERARAIAELADLAVRGADRDEAERTGSPGDLGGGGTEASGTAEPSPIEAAPRPGRLVQWTVAAGIVGLLLGGVLGWAVGQRVPADPASSTVGSSPPADPPVPLEETGLLELFDRLPPAEGSTQVAVIEEAIDPASVRLLATRADGPAAYLARTADGENVCFVVVLPAGPPRAECTVDGLLPAEGLSILYGAEGYGLSAARLDPSGIASLGPVVTF